jgi:hypothetical protein
MPEASPKFQVLRPIWSASSGPRERLCRGRVEIGGEAILSLQKVTSRGMSNAAFTDGCGRLWTL